MKNKKKEDLSINLLIASLLADVDIFLLKEKDQITDKEKHFTVDEIRNQLQRSGEKLNATLEELGFDIHEKLRNNKTILQIKSHD